MDMKTPEFFDPSMPSFRYSDKERTDLLEQGLTEEEINQREADVTNRLARKKFEDESKAA